MEWFVKEKCSCWKHKNKQKCMTRKKNRRRREEKREGKRKGVLKEVEEEEGRIRRG